MSHHIVTTPFEYTAIIVEPRKHPALRFVLSNILENLDQRWGVKICHGTQNLDFILDIVTNDPVIFDNKERIMLENLKVDNLSMQMYNNLMYSQQFYTYIPTETYLIFQTDSMISRKHKHYLDCFLEYDYVGAPWPQEGVGNGGFSLRKKSKMLEIIDKFPDTQGNEDIFFSEGCRKLGFNVPTHDAAKYFSIETVYNHAAFGIHKPWQHMDIQNINCEGIEELCRLNRL